MKRPSQPTFHEVVSIENLFRTWYVFRRGKRKKPDVQHFERYLEDNIFALHHELTQQRYRHGPYERFHVFDPKERLISKASVRDRFVHHLLYDFLTPIFDSRMIHHSFSSRVGKGTHQGVNSLHKMVRQVSANGHKPCYILKLDVRRFFDSIHHQTLKELLRRRVVDIALLRLVEMVIDSFCHEQGPRGACGVPLGNVTSQLFTNIYLHELDDYIKQVIRHPHYARYCDDFVLVDQDMWRLVALLSQIRTYLETRLQLTVHPKKIVLRPYSLGIDFLGYVLFLTHRLLRPKTKRRMQRRLEEGRAGYLAGLLTPTFVLQQLQSYLGILSHANQYELSRVLRNSYV